MLSLSSILGTLPRTRRVAVPTDEWDLEDRIEQAADYFGDILLASRSRYRELIEALAADAYFTAVTHTLMTEPRPVTRFEADLRQAIVATGLDTDPLENYDAIVARLAVVDDVQRAVFTLYHSDGPRTAYEACVVTALREAARDIARREV